MSKEPGDLKILVMAYDPLTRARVTTLLSDQPGISVRDWHDSLKLLK